MSIYSPLTEAIFEPLAAKQRVYGSRYEAAATSNAVLLEVANLYMELLGAEAKLGARRQQPEKPTILPKSHVISRCKAKADLPTPTVRTSSVA